MSETYLDGLLDELVTAEPRVRWDDVLGRARRSQRRYIAVVVTVAALVLVPATWAAVDAFEGTTAPQSIQHTFVEGDAAAAAMQAYDAQNGFKRDVPRADASKAHGVLQLQTSDGPLDMWAAPELDGSGSCWFVAWESDIQGETPEGEGGCTQDDGPAVQFSTFNDDASHPSYTLVEGSVTGSETSLDVTLTDGSTTTLPVVEHLFLGALPHGSDIASIVGRDSAGTVVATWPTAGG
jgi:hypothetical protein